MKRSEFKKRMQSLKSYREQNPDKGYWDWKVEQFEEGGENGNPPKMKEIVQYQDNARVGAATQVPEMPTNIMPVEDYLSAGMLDFAPVVGDAVEVANIAHDVKEGNYKDAAIGLGLLAIPGAAASKVYRAVRNMLASLAFKPSDNKIQTVNRLFRNKEWSNFLSTRNGDAYYRMQRTPGTVSTNISGDNGGYFISHTTPWEEFSGLGTSDGIGMNVLYEFPTQTFGSLKSSNDKGYHGIDDIIEMGKKHLLYGNTSSGKRGFVRIVDDETAEILNMDPYVIGVSDRPLTAKGYYDTRPAYEDIRQSNQTTISPETLNGAILNTDYNMFQYSPDGIIKSKHATNYQRGGEVPPSDYQGSNEPARVNPITGKLLANGAVTPILDLEGAANLTPIGDVLSIRDMYVAARNRDLLGLGLAGLGILPFMSRIRPIDRPPIPTVNRDVIQRQIDLSVSQTDKNKKVLDDFYDQRNGVYESLIENEDAFRRAARADRSSGTSYMQTYQDMVREYGRDGSNLNPNLVQPGYDRSLYEQPVKAQVSTSNPDLIRLNPRYKDPEELDETFQSLNPGLIRHEMGHGVDIKSGMKYTDDLANPSKFESESKLKQMYPKSYKRIQDYLLRGSEIKSHMNEFREFLFNQGEYSTKETVNSLRKKLDKYKSQFKNINILFDAYKNKRQFVKDYNMIPITATENNNDNLV